MTIRPLSSPADVRKRHLRALSRTIAGGVVLRVATVAEAEAARQLFRETLTSEAARTNPDDGRDFLIARDEVDVVGAAAVLLAKFPWGVGMLIHSLAVADGHRENSIGTALVAFAETLSPDLRFAWGGCSTDSMGFYRRMGYAVSSGEREYLSFPDGQRAINSNQNYPLWFSREIRR